MKIYDVLDLTDPKVVVGKHSVWVPPSTLGGWGVKAPFQFGGRVQKYKHPYEQSYDYSTLADEYAMLRVLGPQGITPGVRDWVYFKTVISEHNGAWWADPLGAYGYEMQHADSLPKGVVDAHYLGLVRKAGLIVGSDGAWGDLLVPDRGNIRNGYVIDVRRSSFDMLRLNPERYRLIPGVPLYHEDCQKILLCLSKDGQFPFRERPRPYQDVLLNGIWYGGEREIVQRAAALGFHPEAMDGVLDLGCCTGGFLQYACSVADGAFRVGVDSQAEFVGLARRIARSNGTNVCFRQMDLCDVGLDFLHWLTQVFPRGIDHLLCLSMTKHLGEETMWSLIDMINAKRVYLESNAVKDPPYPLSHGASMRDGTFVGFTTDRNKRACYVLNRE